MSDERPIDADLSRRDFVKATGAVAGAGLLGAGAAAAAADGEFDPAFANWRVREARRVWERGYAGRQDRTVGLTDSGIDARHPDLGPWNGVRAEIEDENLVLTTDETVSGQYPKTRFEDFEQPTFTGQAAPGAGVVGFSATTETYELYVDKVLQNTDDVAEDDLVGARIEATLSWNADTPGPQINDADFELQQRRPDGSWAPVASSGSGGTETQEAPEETLTWTGDLPVKNDEDTTPDEAGAALDHEFRFYVVCWRGAVDFTVDADVDVEVDTGETSPQTRTNEVRFDGSPFDGASKTVGWFDAGPRYGSFDAPRDSDGHGTHCSSIMGGTGQASVVDEANLVQAEPRTVLLPTGNWSRTVEVPADGGVFVSAYGDNVAAEIQFPAGNAVASGGINADHSAFDNTVVDAPAIHDEGTETYTVVVRPMTDPESGSATVGRLQEVAWGPLLPPGDATDGDHRQSLHAGLAPGAGLVGLQGLSAPTAALGEHATDFASTFNLRAVNMSWGYAGGAPLGAAGGLVEQTALGENLPQRLKQIAEGGILPVAAAGNAATPANGNGDPGVADEAISVAATDPVDGLTSYSSGGIGGVDEEGVSTDDSPNEGDRRAYMKPEVTAPGGAADGYPAGGYDLIRAAEAGQADVPEDEQAPVRDYTWKAGTSMAAPYVTGVAGLVAEAMEYRYDAEGNAVDRRADGDPEAVTLPAPANTGYGDVMRLKQAVLATASETAFTAAPFHHPSHRPTYEFGGRDPYEGFGRVNPDAAVDAVSRELLDVPDDLPVTATVSRSEQGETGEVVGLNVPDDPRAVAGYVELGRGTFEASVSFSHYEGGNKGMAAGSPHLDLFVYDAANPGTNGEPNAVAKAQGRQGSAGVTVETAGSLSPEAEADGSVAAAAPGVYYVVAKLVNVPGAVNTNDVQVHFDLDAAFTQAEPAPYAGAQGSRADDGSGFTAGQTNTIDVTVDDLGQAQAVDLYDVIPASWRTVKGTGSADHRRTFEVGDRKWVSLGTITADDLDADEADGDDPDGVDRSAGSVTRTYRVEAPSETGTYTFGPAQARAVGDSRGRYGADKDSPVGGTEENVVVGVSTNTDQGAGQVTDEVAGVTDGVDDATSATGDAVSETTDGVSDTVNDTP